MLQISSHSHHRPRFGGKTRVGMPPAGDGEMPLLVHRGFAIHLAADPVQRARADALIDRLYTSRGYRREPPAPADEHSRLTLLASQAGQAVGTLTLNVDAEHGLLADALYRSEIDGFRRNGGRLCELTGFAVDRETRSRTLLATLFHLLYLAGRQLYRISDVLIEVNPRHRPFYESQLGFRIAGEARECPRVGAPAVLLHATTDSIGKRIDRSVRATEPLRHPLDPHFLAPEAVRLACERIGALPRMTGTTVPGGPLSCPDARRPPPAFARPAGRG